MNAKNTFSMDNAGAYKPILIGLCALALALFTLNINGLSMLYVSSDEMGYLGTAACFAGHDWSGVLSSLYYYSYGYPLLLTPLYWISGDTASVYQLAIFLNAVMATAVIPVAFRVAKKLFPNAGTGAALAVSFCVSLYSGYILQVNMARNETLLFLLFWLIVLLFLDLNTQAPLWKPALLAALLVYSFMVHQRTMGILIASMVTILFLCAKKRIGLKHFVVFAAVMAVMFILHTLLKDYVKSEFWLNSETSVNNDFAASGGKLSRFFTAEGFTSFLKVFSGQIFYLGAASFLIYYLGAGKILKDAVGTLSSSLSLSPKANVPDTTSYTLLFIALSAVFTALISAVFLINPVRLDHIIYGRYNEVVAGPILLYSLLYLFTREKPPVKGMLAGAVLFVILGLITRRGIEGLGSFASISSPGMAWMEPYFADAWQVVILVPLGVFAAIAILSSLKQTGFFFASLAILGAGFVLTGIYPVNNTILPQQQSNLAAVRGPAAYAAENLPAGTEIYCYADGEDAWQFSYLQFALPSHKLIVEPTSNPLPADGATVATTAGSLLSEKMNSAANIVEGSPRFILWETDENKIHGDKTFIPPGMFFTQNGSLEDGALVSDGSAGYLSYGPYISMEHGSYRVEVNVRLLLDEAEQLGTLDIFSNGEVIASADISRQSFDKAGSAVLSLSFELAAPREQVEIRLFTNAGATIELSGATLEQINQ